MCVGFAGIITPLGGTLDFDPGLYYIEQLAEIVCGTVAWAKLSVNKATWVIKEYRQ